MALFGKKPEPPRANPAPPVAGPSTEEEPEIEALEATPPPPTYGIHETIRLMRSLPVDQNADLVVRVIRSTLESLHVRVADIVEDANRQEAAVVGRMRELSREIESMQHEIDLRRRDLATLEAELAEIKLAKERLQLTGEIRSRTPSVPPAMATSAPATPQAPVAPAASVGLGSTAIPAVPQPAAPSASGGPSSSAIPAVPQPAAPSASGGPGAGAVPAVAHPVSAPPPPLLRTPPRLRAGSRGQRPLLRRGSRPGPRPRRRCPSSRAPASGAPRVATPQPGTGSARAAVVGDPGAGDADPELRGPAGPAMGAPAKDGAPVSARRPSPQRRRRRGPSRLGRSRPATTRRRPLAPRRR
jgi:hypothetical protein